MANLIAIKLMINNIKVSVYMHMCTYTHTYIYIYMYKHKHTHEYSHILMHVYINNRSSLYSSLGFTKPSFSLV